MVGIVASSLCLIHCLATPFLFILKACSSSCCADAPIWWQSIDYLFLVVSFVAIRYATKGSTKVWIVKALWVSWFALLCMVLFHTFRFNFFPEQLIYLPAFSIIGLHFYNRKHCRCKAAL